LLSFKEKLVLDGGDAETGEVTIKPRVNQLIYAGLQVWWTPERHDHGSLIPSVSKLIHHLLALPWHDVKYKIHWNIMVVLQNTSIHTGLCSEKTLKFYRDREHKLPQSH
jgi:hypothetical protein